MPAVQLFATCLGDLAFPQAVADAETLLRGAGFEVEFPGRQVCCGQPAFNSGHRAAARRVARSFAKAFSRSAPIVVPSGSCATMASHYLPELVGVEPYEVWELSAFLVHAGYRPLPRNEGRRVAYHDSCHMLRELRIHVGQRIGKFAAPANIVFTPELPKTRSGKIMRRLLRDVAENRELGDTTTLADSAVVEELAKRGREEAKTEE